MAELKKNQMNQIMFVMVDATDFASIESALGAASVAGKFYGVNHGGSAAMTSGALSKACSLVHSGIFRQTLKAAECNYDYTVYRFTATGCADQVMAYQMVTYDDTDTYSMLSDFYSDFGSRVPKAVATASRLLLAESVISDAHSAAAQANSRVLVVRSMASDAHSAAAQANSRALVLQSMLSDADSAVNSQFARLSDYMSDLLSVVTVTGVQLNASSLSDLRSAVNAITLSLGASDLSDIASAVIAGINSGGGVALDASTLSDIRSAVAAVTVTMSASDVSDIASAVVAAIAAGAGVPLDASTMSDLRSAITAGPGTYVSNISDILSMLLVNQSLISDAHSAAAQANSRALVLQSMVSDVDSAVSSQFAALSDMISNVDSALTSQYTAGHPLTASDMSDIRSAIAAIQISASDISDIASAVLYSTRFSNSVVVRIEDIWNALSDTDSAVNSQYSDLKSQLNILQSLISDIDSAITSQHTVMTSALSDIDSALSSQFAAGATASTMSDIQSMLDALSSDLKSQLTIVQSNVSDISSDVTLLTNAMLNKQVVYKATGNVEVYGDAGALVGTVLAAYTSTASDVTRKRLVP